MDKSFIEVVCRDIENTLQANRDKAITARQLDDRMMRHLADLRGIPEEPPQPVRTGRSPRVQDTPEAQLAEKFAAMPDARKEP